MESKDSLINKSLYLKNDALCEFISKQICEECDICGSCRWMISNQCVCVLSKTNNTYRSLDQKKCNAWSVARLDLSSSDTAFGMRRMITDQYGCKIINESVMRAYCAYKEMKYNSNFLMPHPQYGTENDKVRHAYKWMALYAKPIDLAKIACLCVILDN